MQVQQGARCYVCQCSFSLFKICCCESAKLCVHCYFNAVRSSILDLAPVICDHCQNPLQIDVDGQLSFDFDEMESKVTLVAFKEKTILEAFYEEKGHFGFCPNLRHLQTLVNIANQQIQEEEFYTDEKKQILLKEIEEFDNREKVSLFANHFVQKFILNNPPTEDYNWFHYQVPNTISSRIVEAEILKESLNTIFRLLKTNKCNRRSKQTFYDICPNAGHFLETNFDCLGFYSVLELNEV